MEIDHTPFLNNLTLKLDELGIELTDAELDHLAYQAESSQEYDQLKSELEKMATLMKEPLVSDRRIGVFKLNQPLRYKDWSTDTIELIEPKEGQEVVSGLEHAEFLLEESLEDFMAKYPDVNWNTNAINRDPFPMLILELSDSMRVKFPRFPILSDVE